MTDKILYWTSLIAAALALVLMLANSSLINGNQKLQTEIGQRQSVINTAATVAPISQQLSQALYDASVKSGDKKIQDLLTSQGVRLPQPPAAAAKAEKAAPAKAAAPAKTLKQEE